MKQSLNSARQQKEALREDNRRLAEIIDQDDRLLPALVQSARDCAADIEETGSEACTLRETARQLEEIHAERMAAIAQYRQHGSTLHKDV